MKYLLALILSFAACVALADTTIPIGGTKAMTVVAKDAAGNVVTGLTYDFQRNQFCTVNPATGASTVVTASAVGDCVITILSLAGVTLATEIVHVVAGPPTQYVVTWQ